MNNTDIILLIIELLMAIILYIFADVASKVLSPKWKLAYAAPFLTGILFSSLYGVDVCLSGIYLAMALLLLGFFRESKKFRQNMAIVSGVLILTAIPACLLYPGYRTPNFEKEFEHAFSVMKTYYILDEYKGIDWDGLYAKYRPLFREANKKHDPVENVLLWYAFCDEFHDGHVGYGSSSPNSEKMIEQYKERAFGNDYGLSLMTLDNGQTVAVNVEPGSAPALAGVHNGTVITAWDGQEIDSLKAQVTTFLHSYPDKENEDFYRALYAAGIGGEETRITFLDENGQEQTVTAPRIGHYEKRLEKTLDILHQGVEAGNLAWKQSDDKTWCLRVKAMLYDSESYDSGDHSQMQQELREKLLEIRESGATRLVIDLRSNSGGSPQFSMAIASLFAPEGTHTASYDAVWDEEQKTFQKDANGRYVVGTPLTYYGENLWEGREVIVLVNAETVSSGDLLTLLMSRCDNATIMGFTRSNSSCQAIRGVGLSQGAVTFSAVPNLKEDGSFLIDTDSSRASTMPLDVKVPFDQEAVASLFDRGEDYMLDWALRQ